MKMIQYCIELILCVNVALLLTYIGCKLFLTPCLIWIKNFTRKNLHSEILYEVGPLNNGTAHFPPRNSIQLSFNLKVIEWTYLHSKNLHFRLPVALNLLFNVDYRESYYTVVPWRNNLTSNQLEIPREIKNSSTDILNY